MTTETKVCPKPVVGQKFFVEPSGNGPRCGYRPYTGVVTKVGKKYFYLDDKKFDIATRKFTDTEGANFDWLLYETFGEYRRHKTKNIMYEDIRREIERWAHYGCMPSDRCVRAVYDAICLYGNGNLQRRFVSAIHVFEMEGKDPIRHHCDVDLLSHEVTGVPHIVGTILREYVELDQPKGPPKIETVFDLSKDKQTLPADFILGSSYWRDR